MLLPMAELNDWITPWYDYGVPFWAKPFVALTPAQVLALTPELKAELRLEAKSGAYDLYFSVLK